MTNLLMALDEVLVVALIFAILALLLWSGSVLCATALARLADFLDDMFDVSPD